MLRRVQDASVELLGPELAGLVGQILREALALAAIQIILVCSAWFSTFLLLGVSGTSAKVLEFITYAHEAQIVVGIAALSLRSLFHYFSFIKGKR
jgi:hypothetical protein